MDTRCRQYEMVCCGLGSREVPSTVNPWFINHRPTMNVLKWICVGRFIQQQIALTDNDVMHLLLALTLLLCFEETWWRHQMKTLQTICVGKSPVTGEFLTQRPVTRSFHVFFNLRLNYCWANNSDAGDLRRYCAHCDVIIMIYRKLIQTL